MKQKRIGTLQKLGVKEDQDRFGRKTFRPQGKTAHTAPVIMREYYNEEVEQETGESIFTRMYECEPAPGQNETRHFLADTYDASFRPNHGKKLIPVRSSREKVNYKVKGR
jgi:hypothetical protein